MSARRFDDAARILASGLPRRRVIGLLGRSAIGVAAVFASGARTEAAPGCRSEGHPCEGNQTCCAGLICTENGPGAARRCAAGRTTTEPDVIVVGANIDIEADCAYSGETRRTNCTFTATSGDGEVGSLTIPHDVICADVVGGDFEKIESGTSGRAIGNGLKSTRHEGDAAVVLVEMDGVVTTAGTATYWCETEVGQFVPVTGPGLRCAERAATTTTSVSNSTGAVVVQAYTCDVADGGPEIDWFDVCQEPTTQATFQLSRVEGEGSTVVGTQSVDAGGVCRFGALPPGPYRLEQTNGDWCHAESDGVDDQGNVVLGAAEVVTVWIFHCAETG